MSTLLNFQKPDKITMQKADDFEGIFEFKPLEPGFGQTIGNSLRRVLLSSLPGFAISAVRIAGVDHEFATITGVVEDVVDIILNLKQVRLKQEIESDDIEDEKIYLTISGKESFTAGDIGQHTNVFTVMNPDLVICTMEPFVNLEVELTVTKGHGYVPADDNIPKGAPIGVIPVDAIYTPIKNVAYRVESTRVGQRTDYEKLTIEVKTDGTIHPEDAIRDASRILIQHLILITDEPLDLDAAPREETIVDEHILHMRKLLKTSLEDLDLSVRAYNCLKAAKINSLGELVKYDTHELLKFRNFGKKSLVEIEELLNEKGLTFGMDLSKYKLDEE
ncbi:MAG: DNA-directed RNA polymerase subunit alpha [Bacteroidota bacterium]